MATFVEITNGKEFDIYLRQSIRPISGDIAARYWHVDRYLSGIVNSHTRIGKFIWKNEDSRDEVIKIYNYGGYELMINYNPKLGLGWSELHKEGAPLDFTLALTADANPSPGLERLFYGCVDIDGIWYHGQVREDGKCYVAKYFSFMETDVVLTFKEFYILEYTNAEPETAIFAPLNLQLARGNLEPYFHPIRDAEDFNFLVPEEAYRNLNGELLLPARFLHFERYLPGFVNVSTRIGMFIRKDEAQQQRIITTHNYGYDLLVNWTDTLDWKMHHNGGEDDHLDLTNAFPADPEAAELLYYGRCSPGNDIICCGIVYEDGNCYAHFADDMLILGSCFEVLEYKQPLHQ